MTIREVYNVQPKSWTVVTVPNPKCRIRAGKKNAHSQLIVKWATPSGSYPVLAHAANMILKPKNPCKTEGLSSVLSQTQFPVYSMSTTMKVSPYLCHDNHPAIIFLRLGTIILSIVSLVVFIIVMDAHNKVYTDGMGSFLTLFPLIFVRSSLKSWLVDRVANQERLHMVLFGPPLSF